MQKVPTAQLAAFHTGATDCQSLVRQNARPFQRADLHFNTSRVPPTPNAAIIAFNDESFTHGRFGSSPKSETLKPSGKALPTVISGIFPPAVFCVPPARTFAFWGGLVYLSFTSLH